MSDNLRAALEVALSVALHEQQDPGCTGEPDYLATTEQAHDLVRRVWSMPLVQLALASPSPEPLDVLVKQYDIAMTAIRRRHAQWAEGFPGDIEAGHLRQHPETQCFADIDRGELLAIIDRALAAHLSEDS